MAQGCVLPVFENLLHFADILFFVHHHGGSTFVCWKYDNGRVFLELADDLSLPEGDVGSRWLVSGLRSLPV